MDVGVGLAHRRVQLADLGVHVGGGVVDARLAIVAAARPTAAAVIFRGVIGTRGGVIIPVAAATAIDPVGGSVIVPISTGRTAATTVGLDELFGRLRCGRAALTSPAASPRSSHPHRGHRQQHHRHREKQGHPRRHHHPPRGPASAAAGTRAGQGHSGRRPSAANEQDTNKGGAALSTAPRPARPSARPPVLATHTSTRGDPHEPTNRGR